MRGVASIVGPFISTVLYNPSVSAAEYVRPSFPSLDESNAPPSSFPPFLLPFRRSLSFLTASPAWGRYGFSRVIVFVGVMSFVSAFGGAGLLWARRRKAGAKERERLCGFGRRDGGVLRGTVIE